MKIIKRLILCMLVLVGISVHGQGLYGSVIDNESEFNKYTVVDANGDGSKWNFSMFMYAACSLRDYDADDWLITPAISFEAGKTYQVKFKAKTDYAMTDEILSVKFGSKATVADMTTDIKSNLVVNENKSKEFTETFVATETGNGYIGFRHHTTGEAMSEYLYIESISVEEVSDQSVPGKVTGFMVTAADKGELKATISFTTPTLTAEGLALASLTKVEVYRDNEIVKIFNNPNVGQQLNFEDTNISNGNHTYKVVAVNGVGQGEGVEQSVFVGVDIPGAVTNLNFVYDYETHTSTVTWDAPTVGANGGYINPDALTYNVRRFRKDDPQAIGLTEKTFEDEVTIDFLLAAEEETRKKYEELGMPVVVNYVIDGQGLMQYYVKAVSAAGEGAEVRSNNIIIGKQNTLPYKESFANGTISHYWRTDISDGSARWRIFDDNRYSQDDDDGFIAFNAVDDNATTALVHTGNISMKTAISPVLTFYYYIAYPMLNPLNIKVSKNNSEFETIMAVDLMEDESKVLKYNKVSIPLESCAGYDHVKVGFEVTSGSNIDLIYIDNIRIVDQRDNDLSVEIKSLPRTLKVDEERKATVVVENYGLNDVAEGEYVVKAYVDGKWAGTQNGAAVAAGESVELTIPVKANIRMKKESSIFFMVDYAKDGMADNNKSQEQTIIVKMPNLPEPTELAITTGDNVYLTWNVPAAPRAEDGQVVESFEDYDDFMMTNFGEWTIIDYDKKLTYGIEGWYFPNNSKAMSYMIFNPSEVSNSSTGNKGLTDPLWQPRTGDKMLASFAAYETDSEDWLISPELSGNEQTISFYAHHMPKSPVEESFYVYYSTTDMEQSSFTQLEQSPSITTTSWEDKYEYNLPQGAKYFAIRKVTNDGWVLFIDDITFSPDTLAAQPGLILSGYNVYKNGACITEAPVPANSFTDADGKPGDYYRVTAVYNNGESQMSNYVIYIDELGIAEMEETISDDKACYDIMGRRVNDNYKGIVISNGKKLIRK
ncbi:MAG: choice-of-anchor J domain-containing protein [Prevotella sp.]|nr:choice-of-anchor J domain-containing protein [Prevotella sp.]